MKHRPKYLDLARIRLPLPGFVSILHRLSGFLLYLAIPLLLYLLQQSLGSGRAFEAVRIMLDSIPFKMLMVFLLWTFLHHLCAGIRILLLDMGIGVALRAARASSRWVMLASLSLTLVTGIRIW